MSEISRRAWLKAVALVSAAAATPLMLASTPAEAKVIKAAVHYRDHPNGMQMCHMCKYYIASGGRSAGMSCMGMMGTGACQLVQGTISPMGWCDLYSPA
jgi:nitrous oxide reductase